MAANDVMSHTEPDGTKVFDRINAADITWYAAGEIIAWNHYPAEYSTAEAIRAWMGVARSPRDHGLDRLQLRRVRGRRCPPTGKRYYAGVFVKEPDQTGAVGAGSGTVSMRIRRRAPQAGHRPLVGRRYPRSRS